MTEQAPTYQTWIPEPITERELTLDFQMMRSETNDCWCVCIVSRFRQPKNRLEQDEAAALVPILSVNAWGLSPQDAQYEAYKQAAYYLHYGLLPAPEELRLPGNLGMPVGPTQWLGDDPSELTFENSYDRVGIIPREELEKGPI